MRTDHYQRTMITDLLFEYRGYTVNLYEIQSSATPSTALSLLYGLTEPTCVPNCTGSDWACRLDRRTSRLSMPSASSIATVIHPLPRHNLTSSTRYEGCCRRRTCSKGRSDGSCYQGQTSMCGVPLFLLDSELGRFCEVFGTMR